MSEEPRESAASAGADPENAADEVVEAELVESDVVIVEEEFIEPATTADEPLADNPADHANESLAAAAAAAAASTQADAAPAPVDEASAPADWRIDEGLTPPAPQYVVVEPPRAPDRRGNRGLGSLLALAGALVYGGALVGVAYLLEAIQGTPNVAFLQDWHFYVPIAIFAVLFVVLVLLVNRAGWWAHILGSLVIALAVYFGTAAADAWIEGMRGSSGVHSIGENLSAPFVILAAIVAREVAVWWGWLIAYRGRRVTVRNRADREAYDREVEAFRARYGN